MYKEVLRSIEGVGVFPSISLILFMGFFVALLVWLYKKGKVHFEDVSRLPLESDDSTDNYQKV